MTDKENKKLIVSETVSITKNGPKTLSYTFSIEIFRFIGFTALVIVVNMGNYLSNKYVFKPNGPRAIEDTEIYKLFGFNHICNVIDFNPAKEFAAVTIFLVQVPLSIFIILSYFRIRLAYMNGEISKGLHDYSILIKPFCLISMTSLHMWFVNSPQHSYPEGYGFTGHYIPYMTFKLSMMLMAVEQIRYYTELKLISVGPTLGKIYIWFIVILTLFYVACTISTIMGSPILDSKNNKTDNAIFVAMLGIFDICSALLPMIFSGIQIFNGDNNTITFGHQGSDGLPAFEKKQTDEEESILKADFFTDEQ